MQNDRSIQRMVAKITFPNDIRSALNYNEQKVQKGVAECLGAGNVLGELHRLNFYHKLALFENRNMLNERASTKTIHVSLNFSPAEKLNTKQLMAIAENYMGKIGFGEQPYLVYQHRDAGHPHLHIVSTTIQQDGSRINTHNIGRNQSEKARKELEQEFGLIKAEQQKNVQVIKPINADVVVYGKQETKRSITNVVNSVISSYNYTSLIEFNAVLKQYNVVADSGEKEGRMYRHGGLVYRLLDDAGNKIGVPIKASAISSKPTLPYLEQRFERNKANREAPKVLLKKTLNEALQKSPKSLQDFINLLAKNRVFTRVRQNEEGLIYGITFVDNQNKAVFNGSDLGRQYSIGALQSHWFKPVLRERNGVEQTTGNINSNAEDKHPQTSGAVQPLHQLTNENKETQKENLLQQLITPEPINENLPVQLVKKNKKRKKKNRNL